MPVVVNGVKLQCPSCGNTESISINGSDSRTTHFTCMKCGTSSTVNH